MKYTTNIDYTLKDIEFENEFFADSKIITNEDMARRITNIMDILLKDILFEGNYINTFYDVTTDKEYFVYKDGSLVEIQELNDKNKYLSFKLSERMINI